MKTQVTELLGTRYPIIQAPLARLNSPTFGQVKIPQAGRFDLYTDLFCLQAICREPGNVKAASMPSLLMAFAGDQASVCTSRAAASLSR